MPASELRLTIRPRPLCRSSGAAACAQRKNALEVHADDPIPLLLANVVQRGDPDDPGAIDERIEAAESRLAGADRRAHGVGGGHVEIEG